MREKNAEYASIVAHLMDYPFELHTRIDNALVEEREKLLREFSILQTRFRAIRRSILEESIRKYFKIFPEVQKVSWGSWQDYNDWCYDDVIEAITINDTLVPWSNEDKHHVKFDLSPQNAGLALRHLLLEIKSNFGLSFFHALFKNDFSQNPAEKLIFTNKPESGPIVCEADGDESQIDFSADEYNPAEYAVANPNPTAAHPPAEEYILLPCPKKLAPRVAREFLDQNQIVLFKDRLRELTALRRRIQEIDIEILACCVNPTLAEWQVPYPLVIRTFLKLPFLEQHKYRSVVLQSYVPDLEVLFGEKIERRGSNGEVVYEEYQYQFDLCNSSPYSVQRSPGPLRDMQVLMSLILSVFGPYLFSNIAGFYGDIELHQNSSKIRTPSEAGGSFMPNWGFEP